MISVHDRTATSFTATGVGVLDRDIINPVVSEELGGGFQLSFTYPAGGPAAAHLVPENIVSTPVPGLEARQGFRIHEVTTQLGSMLEVTCFHMFYDLAANLIADTFVVNQTPTAALTQILGSANTAHGFTASSSDTSSRASARIVRMPVAQALMDTGEDNSFASRWGGEITRDNWHIHHAHTRGQNRGVVIRDRKNLTGYQSTIDMSSVVTRILPIGYDGLLLPELYVDSEKIGNYQVPHIRVLRYQDVKAIKDPERPREDELPLEDALAELRRRARLEYTQACVDEPSASYTVSFMDLASTKEYADLATLETVELGDTLTVRHDDLGVALSARVVAYEYNPLTRQYISVDLGSVARSFTSVTRTVTNAVKTAEAATDLAGIALASADGKTTNYYGPTQPTSARLGDTWFRENGEQIEIWVYQITDTGQPGWVAVATDLNHAQLSAELDAARAEVAAAQQAADDAQATADQVGARLASAQVEIEQAKNDAAQAAATAQQVLADSGEIGRRLDEVENELATTRDEATRAGALADQINTASQQWASRLSQAEEDLADTATAVSSLDSRLDDVDAQAAQAAQELSSLNTRLSGVDQQISSLAADAQAAHNEAASAAQAAQAATQEAARAAGIADGKADVLIQAATPAASMRKASTLWIDTTGGANTPKRWDGTAWVPVTDGVARDAASKAASASSAAANAQAAADAAYALADSKPSDAEVAQLTQQAQAAAITAAKADATAKADKAKADALAAAATDATSKADAAKAAAIAAASADAATKAAQTLAQAQAALNAALAQARSEITTEIQTSANGKNTLTLSTSSPSGSGTRTGDTWWRHTGGVIIGQWTWNGTSWLATTLRHEVIASVDVNALVVSGTARMNEAAVKKIIGDAAFFKQLTTNKLLVAAPDNILPGGDIAAEPAWWPTQLTRTTDDKPTGYGASLVTSAGQETLMLTTADLFVPVTPGATYGFEIWIKADKPGSKFFLALLNQSGTHAGTASTVLTAGDSPVGSGAYLLNNVDVPTEWTRFSCRYTMSASTTQVRLGSAYFNHTNGTEQTAIISIGGIRLRPMTGATLIEDGAITTDKIAANAITATHVKAGAITSDKLTIAAGFITNAMIANAAITDAKISDLSAAKITTGTLAAARIAAGSITSDKLTIANGFIQTAMIADAAITDAKIANLSAAKITTGTLAAARIAAGSITSDKLTIAAGFITSAMIADAAITDAKIANLSAAKITTGTLAAARIAAGSITSDKLTIANGFIQTAMIADAAISSAKIASLDAAKITTGTLAAARIAAGSITADKLASNAIQVGLAGWTSTIRITPTAISWYSGTSLEGQITSSGMAFWYGTRKIGWMGEQYKLNYPDIRGITNALEYTGDFVDWSYKKSTTDTAYTSLFTLDPKGKFHGQSGIHLGTALYMHGWAAYTSGNRPLILQDATLTNVGTFAALATPSNKAKVVFGTNDLYVVTNSSYYNMTRLFDRVKDLMSRINTLINLLNKGWITSITDKGGGQISWSYYSNTGTTAMSTTLA
jgi:phage minor structural protein